MGNFEINEPTEEQLNALTKLTTALMIRYRINPDSEIYAHIEDDNEPYVKDVVRTSFIGHRDTGKTACPGKNLYSKLPIITQAIRTQLLIQKKSFSVNKVRKIYNHKETVVLEKDQ
jgi:N-acetyl-anhydromuramyl-L-alanine amidase AmpD